MLIHLQNHTQEFPFNPLHFLLLLLQLFDQENNDETIAKILTKAFLNNNMELSGNSFPHTLSEYVCMYSQSINVKLYSYFFYFSSRRQVSKVLANQPNTGLKTKMGHTSV